jgi:hypothetical protein
MKEANQFYKNKLTKDGLASWCKTCEAEFHAEYRKQNKVFLSQYNKDYRFKNKESLRHKRKTYLKEHPAEVAIGKLKCYFKVSKIEATKLYSQKQSGICEICHQPEINKRQVISIDHDHKTGKIRGILCSKCNTTLGLVNDSVEILQQAIKYLRKHHG